MHVCEDIRRYNTSWGGIEQVLQVFSLKKRFRTDSRATPTAPLVLLIFTASAVCKYNTSALGIHVDAH